MRVITAVLAAVGLWVVVLPATAMAGTTSQSNEIYSFWPTPVVSDSHRYRINLTAGTSLDATVTWEDPHTDIDLLLGPPPGDCSGFLPSFGCIPAWTTDLVLDVACQDEGAQSQTVGLGPAQESISTTADAHDSGEAEYSLWVTISTSVPDRYVPYTLTVTTGDDGDEDIANEPGSYDVLRPDGHCRTP